MTTRASEVKNIWIAAGDGDLERVKELIENYGLTPESPDSNTYTPLHAAASYAQLDVLTYLLAKGGNINVTDNEGETPLFTAESVATAQWLVEHGADPKHQNLEGQTAADFLEEDSPEVAAYIRSLLPASLQRAPISAAADEEGAESNDMSDADEDDTNVGSLLTNEHLSSLMAERLTEEQTTALMGQFEEIMKRCEEDGVNRDAELAELVQNALFGAMEAGRAMGDDEAAPASTEDSAAPSSSKRSRTQPDR